MSNDKFGLHLPLNSTSIGQIGWSVAREFFSRGLNPSFFLIGQPDASSQIQDENFNNWINECVARGLKDFKRNYPLFKCWHLMGSMESFSNHQNLLSFHEVIGHTPEELNIIENCNKVYFTSQFSVDNFKSGGAKNVEFINLFFDHIHYKRQTIDSNGRIVWNLVGKFEPLRKSHLKTLECWIKKFGNNPKHLLNLNIPNNFLQPEQVIGAINQTIAQASNNQRIWNINNLVKWFPSNLEYSQILNSADIVLAMGNEGYGWPEMTSVALGKHAIVFDVMGHQSWATKENSVLVDKSGLVPAVDNVFFYTGQKFNQGSFYSWSEEDLFKAFDEVVARVEKNKLNEEGLKLQDLTVAKFVDRILEDL